MEGVFIDGAGPACGMVYAVRSERNGVKPDKTNAARQLDRAGIAYELVQYEVDETDLGAAHLAKQLGEDIDTVFKTLVAKGDKTGHVVFVIPGGAELDLKKAARASGNKSCAMLPLKELQNVTGYIRGGCSPLAMKKAFPTFIDESALLHDAVYVSAGKRGLQLHLAPESLLLSTGAKTADLTVG